uniref:cytochrome b5-like n=1 Tax=Erigeron canadensis TaxID=72917 RepID=UPI001CB92F5C|nr:cytochrome b5-like [Erigeron canadensis]
MKLNNKVFGLADVSLHNNNKDCWVIINARVYDVTNFLNDHPGGDNVLLDVAGKDASEEFEEVGHGSAARLMLDEYYIGEVDVVIPSYSTSTPKTPKTGTQTNLQASLQEEEQSRFSFMMKSVGLLPLITIFVVAVGFLLYK